MLGGSTPRMVRARPRETAESGLQKYWEGRIMWQCLQHSWLRRGIQLTTCVQHGSASQGNESTPAGDFAGPQLIQAAALAADSIVPWRTFRLQVTEGCSAAEGILQELARGEHWSPGSQFVPRGSMRPYGWFPVQLDSCVVFVVVSGEALSSASLVWLRPAFAGQGLWRQGCLGHHIGQFAKPCHPSCAGFFGPLERSARCVFPMESLRSASRASLCSGCWAAAGRC